MSGNLSGFNAADVEPIRRFTPLPAGEYQAIISESEMKPTKDGAGQYLQMKLQILNGQHQNRTLFDRLNLGEQKRRCRTDRKGYVVQYLSSG
jgi:hypothetical protein